MEGIVLSQEILQQISEYLQKGRSKNVKALVTEALEAGIDPKDILNEGLLAGMTVVGEKFKKDEIFVPEVLVAARAMSNGVALLESSLVEAGNEPAGTAVIGTVKGDMHDIGKNLVITMFKGAGFKVIDAGVDCPPERFIQLAEENHADVIGLSALLTTTMPNIKAVIDQMKEEGVRDKYIVMVGGAPITQDFADQVGADYFTPDAASAAEVAKKAIS